MISRLLAWLDPRGWWAALRDGYRAGRRAAAQGWELEGIDWAKTVTYRRPAGTFRRGPDGSWQFEPPEHS